MTCKEFIELIADYLDDDLSADIVAEMERHLDVCDPCRAYLATYRRTKTIVAAAARIDVPDEVQARVRHALRERLRR